MAGRDNSVNQDCNLFDGNQKQEILQKWDELRKHISDVSQGDSEIQTNISGGTPTKVLLHLTKKPIHTPAYHQDLTGRIPPELSDIFYSAVKQTSNIHLLTIAIQCLTLTVQATPKDYSELFSRLGMLGALHWNHFSQLGDPQARNTSINYMAQAILLAPKNHPEMRSWLHALGCAYEHRFEPYRDIEDINSSIDCYSKSRKLASHNMTVQKCLGALSRAHCLRFQALGEQDDVDKAIDYMTEAASAIPQESPEACTHLCILGGLYKLRFSILGQVADMSKSIESHSQAVTTTPQHSGDRIGLIDILANSYMYRYAHLGNIDDATQAIMYLSQALSLEYLDQRYKPILLASLGNCYGRLFERTHVLDDIARAIGYYTESIALMPQGAAKLPKLLDCLGRCHSLKFIHHNTPESVKNAIEYIARSISLTPQGHSELPSRLACLGDLYGMHSRGSHEQEDINKSIELFSRAVSLVPQGHESGLVWISSLAEAYISRFLCYGKVSDIDKAIEYYSQVVPSCSTNQTDMARWVNNLGSSYGHRFQRLRREDDIDRAIELHTRATSIVAESHPDFPCWLNSLGSSYSPRYAHLDRQEDLDMAIYNHSRALSLTLEGHWHQNISSWLESLGSSHIQRFVRGNDVNDLNKGIELHSKAVSLTKQGHIDMPRRLAALGHSCMIGYKHLKRHSDLDNAIDYLTRAVQLTPDNHTDATYRLGNLVECLLGRFQQSKDENYLHDALRHLRKVSRCSAGYPKVRIEAAGLWTRVSKAKAIPEYLEAYGLTMELIPQLVWAGSRIDQRYQEAIEVGDLAVEATAAAIEDHRYEKALEWLEQGRAVIWSQKLQMNAPLDMLSSVDPSLAAILSRTADQLHLLSLQAHSSTSIKSQYLPSTEQIAHERHRLAESYEELLQQARQKPGFEDYLRPKRASELVQTARSGPVVVINIHVSRCDALCIVPGESRVTHTPLPDLFLPQVNEARDKLKHILHSQNLRQQHILKDHTESTTDHEFRDILSDLWMYITAPVLQALGYMPAAKGVLPHITWCTTGALSFLPLHSAGLYDSTDSKLYDYAISSYTPSLTCLLSPNVLSTKTPTKILAVGQEATPGHTYLPGTKTELDRIKMHIPPLLQYTQLDGSKATLKTTLTELEHNDWVHLACHAYQSVQDPMESGFFLHDGTLSLASLAAKAFKNKGLAFSSACQTAMGTRRLADEAAHLASGMLMAGYPSVIATMWSINDSDAPLVAESVYVELLKDGVMDHRGSAKALHDAVAQLRDKVGCDAFDRWVPFIHLGV